MSSSIFYACLPGLERVLAQELAAFKPRVLSGGCEVRREPSVAPACASHKLVRLDSPFESRFFDELETGFARLEVAKVLKGKTVGLSVSSSKSRLYHVGAIADRLCKLFPFVKSGGGGGVDAKLHVRLFRDKCQVSLEEGEPLHKRGYRLETGKVRCPSNGIDERTDLLEGSSSRRHFVGAGASCKNG
jgi:23S rRNA G2445 N2-methylase RlmL